VQPDPTPPPRPWVVWGTAAALAVGAAALYARSLPYPFLSMDDSAYPLNPHVVGGLTAENVRWAFTTGEQANWHPLTWLSLQLDASLWGAGEPAPFRAANVLLHGVNAALVFVVWRTLTGAVGRSAAVAALWAAHPLHVESVVWISERKDVLSTLFWLLATLAYAGYARRPSVGRYLLVAGLMALGLMAKPMLVTLPCVFLLLDFWPLRRGLRVVEKLPLFALAVASSIVTVVVQDREGAVGSFVAFGFGPRAATAAAAYAAYLRQTVWPADLGVYYPLVRRSLADPGVLAALGLLAAITFGCLRWGKRYPYLPVGWLWFLGTLVPVIGVVQVGGQCRADRYTYVPHIGLFVAVVWGAADLLRRWPAARAGLAAVAVGGAAAACWWQVGHWRGDEEIWSRAVAVTGPDNGMARLNLGFARRRVGRLDEALADIRAAVEYDPLNPFAQGYLADVLTDLGRFDEAVRPRAEAVRLQPTAPGPKLELGRALVRAGRAADAVPFFREGGSAGELAWTSAIAEGRGLVARGEVAAARERFARAAATGPGLAEPVYLLGVCDDLDGKPAEAAEHLREAAKLGSAAASARLALVLIRLKQSAEAVAAGDAAVARAPADPAAHAARGAALREVGRHDDAMASFGEANRLDPGWSAATVREAWAILDGPAWRTGADAAWQMVVPVLFATSGKDASLSAAMAAIAAVRGEFTAAAQMADRAAELAEEAGRPATADEYRRQAARYRAGKPHRD
jgi:tetratricopeptide (TPR) repeat protein